MILQSALAKLRERKTEAAVIFDELQPRDIIRRAKSAADAFPHSRTRQRQARSHTLQELSLPAINSRASQSAGGRKSEGQIKEGGQRKISLQALERLSAPATIGAPRTTKTGERGRRPVDTVQSGDRRGRAIDTIDAALAPSLHKVGVALSNECRPTNNPEDRGRPSKGRARSMSQRLSVRPTMPSSHSKTYLQTKAFVWA